jgi:bifunctional DNA-binding transcriptional regulator/antitoxin component of YhaV-PrlF toxin-antitoxin module
MSAEPKAFTATVEHDERGRVWVTVPFDPAAEWGRKGRHHVRGELNGTPFETSLGVRGGRVLFPLNKALREAAGLHPGDRVAVVLEPAGERTENVPTELAELLAGDEPARTFFEELSGFYRRQYASWVGQAARADTRQHRAAEVIALLRDSRKAR